MNCDPCKTLSCETQDDFAVYSLQGSAENPTDDPSGTPPCSPCASLSCPAMEPDIEIYSLQTNIIFNTDPITVEVPCPYGWECDETVIITYPPGTFVLDPPDDGIYTAQGCLSLVTAPTAEQLFQLLAAQEAYCHVVTNPPETWHPPSFPPPPPAEREWRNVSVTTSVACTPPQELIVSGTAPSWITVDESSGTITGAAGTFASDVSQADANSRAQTALNEWVSQAQSDGTIVCQEPYSNELQTINCPSGNSDYYRSYNASIDGNGIYAIDGTVYVAAGYYNAVSQAAANALAAAAGQARFDAAVATNQIKCCTSTDQFPLVVSSYTADPADYDVAYASNGYGMTINIDSLVSSSCTPNPVCRWSYTPAGQCTMVIDCRIPGCFAGKTLQVSLEAAMSDILGWGYNNYYAHARYGASVEASVNLNLGGSIRPCNDGPCPDTDPGPGNSSGSDTGTISVPADCNDIPVGDPGAHAYYMSLVINSFNWAGGSLSATMSYTLIP